MKTDLEDNYDITVDNMVDIGCEEAGLYKKEKATFFNAKGKEEQRDVLVYEDPETFNRYQIFAMKDGSFVLETEIDMEVEYYHSDKLIDLL